ncbi:hypothetical protein [Streptomyces sp. NPDC017086]|uniref:hypothetical protein n=1 Tax=Streptomyces sp. NPDC017086 TaxID=3364976 RepID=UPI00379E3E98
MTSTAATLAQVRSSLATGRAVVLPNPAPLTHVITATGPRAVNEAKGRPPGRPVALWAHHPGTLRALDPLWDLTPRCRTLARWLLAEEHLTVLLPLRPRATCPAWLAPAEKDGWILLFGARWDPLRPVLDAQPLLYVSSANRTGRPPAATTAEALAMFPATVPVLAPPPAAGPDTPREAVPRQATTTVRLHPDGRLLLHRDGAQNRPYPRPEDYLARLRARAGGRDTGRPGPRRT